MCILRETRLSGLRPPTRPHRTASRPRGDAPGAGLPGGARRRREAFRWWCSGCFRSCTATPRPSPHHEPAHLPAEVCWHPPTHPRCTRLPLCAPPLWCWCAWRGPGSQPRALTTRWSGGGGTAPWSWTCPCRWVCMCRRGRGWLWGAMDCRGIVGAGRRGEVGIPGTASSPCRSRWGGGGRAARGWHVGGCCKSGGRALADASCSPHAPSTASHLAATPAQPPTDAGQALGEMFNCNHFLVSQTNPHIVPLLNMKKAFSRKWANILEAELKHRRVRAGGREGGKHRRVRARGREGGSGADGLRCRPFALPCAHTRARPCPQPYPPPACVSCPPTPFPPLSPW